MPVNAISQNISVVCPTWNGELFIKNTLDSLLAQELHPGEIIFCDDGSSDATVDILKSYVPSFEQHNVTVKIICNQHGGVSRNRNSGIFAASGTWIALLDSDDLWASNKIKRVCVAMIEHPEANFFIHHEEYRRLKAAPLLIASGSQFCDGVPLGYQLYIQNMFSPSASITCKALLIQVNGFDPVIKAGVEDYELWLRLAPLLKVCVIPEVLGYYLEREGSLVSLPYWKKWPNLMHIYLRHWQKGGIKLCIKKCCDITFSWEWKRSIVKLIRNDRGH